MSRLRLSTLALCALLLAPALAAQTRPQAPRTTEAVTAETDRDVASPRALQLTLDEALRIAMRQNLGVELQRYEFRQSGEDLRSQYGIFDWYSTANIGRDSNETPTISRFQPTGSGGYDANFGVGQTIPTGGQYTVGWTNSRATTTGGGANISPAYRSGLAFNFNQPLMRDFGVDVTRRGITIARNTLGINREAFRTQLMNTAVSVEQAYLNLIYARRQVEVVKEALFLARDQGRITQIRIEVGASAPLDILQPRVQIATSEESLILAVAEVRNAEDILRALLNLDRSEWDRPIVPTDEVISTPTTVDVDAAVDRALQLRPEVRQQALRTSTTRVQHLYARNQVLPQIDFGVGYNLNGLAGRTIEIDETTGQPTGRIFSSNYGEAVSQLFENQFPSWNVGVNFALPIRNIAARAEARRAELDLQQSRVDEASTRQNIILDVRQSARLIDTTARTIAATRAAREAAEQNLEAERRRYENGMTTNFQVLEVQRQLSEARVRELQALIGYNQAVADFHRAVGDVLEARNIAVEEPPVEEPQAFRWLDRYNWLNYGSRIEESVK